MTDDRPAPAEPASNELNERQDDLRESGDGARKVAPRKRWLLWAGTAVVMVAVVALVVALTSESQIAPPPGPLEVARPAPIATPSPTPPPRVTPSATPSPTPSPSAAGQVTITETKSMAFSPVWDPPDHGQDFWQIVDPEYGYPESGGTQYVLAHACAAGDCAGDEFRKLEVGDTLTYKGETYEVEDRWKVWKEEIAQQDIWFHDPDRIVLITCIIEVQGVRAVQNDIIIAHKA